MLEYFGWDEAACSITKALEALFSEEMATVDLASHMPGGKILNTEDFARELIKGL
jgi:isocitrate dehydrogenase